MNRDEAKNILELHRPGAAEDRHDPLLAEALRLLEGDPELQAWFAEAQATDARIAEEFARIEAPADRRAEILAGMRAHALESGDNRPQAADAATLSRSWWRNPWVGIAAVFALLFALSFIPQGAQRGAQLAADRQQQPTVQAGIPGFIEFLASEIDQLPSKNFDKRSVQPGTLQAYLAGTGTPSPRRLPEPVEGKPSIGCFSLEYNGMKMGLICFQNDELIHLTTLRKTDCIDQLPSETTIYELREQAFKVWVEGDEVYILSVHGCKEKLSEVI